MSLISKLHGASRTTALLLALTSLGSSFAAKKAQAAPAPESDGTTPVSDVTPGEKTIPLEEQDVIPIGSPEGPVAVNMNYILRTGNSTVSTFGVDWNAKDDTGAPDALISALRDIYDRVSEKITRSDIGQSLLAKEYWDKKDRVQWEKLLSETVAQETAKTPGMAHYRTTADVGALAGPIRVDAVDIHQLNDISSDIKNNTEIMRFDCDVESLIKAAVIQTIENDLLPDRASLGNYKKASAYFIVSGEYADAKVAGGHTSIFTPVGNMIEATWTKSSYRESQYEDSTLRGFVTGHAFFTKFGGGVYGIPMANTPLGQEPTLAQLRAQVEALRKIEHPAAAMKKPAPAHKTSPAQTGTQSASPEKKSPRLFGNTGKGTRKPAKSGRDALIAPSFK